MYGKALMIKAQKVWKLPKGKEDMREGICKSGEYFGQLKKDGYYYQFEKDAEGNCFLFSRVVSEVTGYLSEKSANVPHLIKFLDSRLPNGTILVGEIYYPNKTSKDVTKIMGCDADKAVARQNEDFGLIHFYLHDMLMYNGESYLDKTNEERLDKLNVIVFRHVLRDNKCIELAETFYDNLDARIDKAFEDGEEGMVLKKRDALYVAGKKPAWNMIKFKIEDEADVICTGFEPSTVRYTGKEIDNWDYWETPSGRKFLKMEYNFSSKELLEQGNTPITKGHYMGWTGAIRIGAYKRGQIVEIGTVSSGLTDEMCIEFLSNPYKFIGHPLAVGYMMVGIDGLRHARISRWRLDDIDPKDCSWDKIFK